jgi:multidrug efflux pump subunit AcrB
VPASIGRVTLAPSFSVLINVEGRDLGGVMADVQREVEALGREQAAGNRIEIRGQAEAMRMAYVELARGLALSAVLVFLVLVVNFQSWRIPLVAMAGLPVAIAGAGIGLWITGTALSVPALMGVMMVIGVSTANSVLVASFARDRLAEGAVPVQAALDAASTRLRPVLMTASAMIIGILPMAFGFGEGGEQNAPLGRAVVGGLVFGTVATLTIVPTLFALVARSAGAPDNVVENPHAS